MLYLWNTGITDEGMKELAAFKNLRMLGMNSTKITDAGLRELKHCTTLRTLSLDSNMLTDANIRAIREAGLLHKVRQARGIRDRHPTSVDEVTVLDLNSAPVLDGGLKELASLKNLGWLNLNDTRVTDAGLKELARFKNMNALHLRNTLVTDAGLKELEGLKELTVLDLRKTKVTETGMAYLAKCCRSATCSAEQELRLADAGSALSAAIIGLASVQVTHSASVVSSLRFRLLRPEIQLGHHNSGDELDHLPVGLRVRKFSRGELLDGGLQDADGRPELVTGRNRHELLGVPNTSLSENISPDCTSVFQVRHVALVRPASVAPMRAATPSFERCWGSNG